MPHAANWSMILPSATVIGAAGSAVGAGPATTAPSVILNLEPWQGQSMVPSATWLHRHPTCVQIALKALKTPLAGWVTTTLASVKTMPPPSGMSAVRPSTVPPEPPERPAGADLADAAGAEVAGATAKSGPGACPSSSAS
jgi:hypothetical protein